MFPWASADSAVVLGAGVPPVSVDVVKDVGLAALAFGEGVRAGTYPDWYVGAEVVLGSEV